MTGPSAASGTAPSPAAPASPEQVLSRASIRAADHLGLTNALLARILGLSEASVSRLRAGRYLLQRDRKEFELAQLFLRIVRSLDAVTGGDDASARSWLRADNLALGARPIDLMTTVRGLVATADYVDSRRAVL
ncbi:MbcA/ParS/Xre antitoxin family protein [Caenispirillum bisanense]|uniref:MbcA/ParS/Xre antitoxin family protein n=1 Tax=Caenispirillum bisanense TaxID=414052 RepID=UPI0031D9B087